MQAIDVQKYLVAVFAACFIGIGSGFLTLAEYMFDRDKEAAKHTIEFETLTKTKVDKNTDCEKVESYREKCTYTMYLNESKEGIWKVLEFLANLLKFTGLGCLRVAGAIEVWRKKS